MEGSHALTFKDFIEFKNSKEWLEFEKYYNESTFLNQINFFRFEDLHTNFLSSLLEEDNCYNLGNNALKLLIDLLATKSENIFPNNELLEPFNLTEITIESQRDIPNYKSRLDIFIQFKLNDTQYLIVIENKFFSSEGIKQCVRYKEAVENYSKTEKKIFVYLSLEENPTITDNSYIKISYKELISKVYIPCSIKSNKQDFVLNLDEYIKSFCSLYDSTDIDYKNIPLTYEGEKLTLSVWKKYNLFLKKLIEDDIDPQFKNFYKSHFNTLNTLFINILNSSIKTEYKMDEKLIEIISNRFAKKRKKNWFNGKFYNNIELEYEVFKYIIENEKIENLSDLDPLNTLSGYMWKALISESQIKEEPNKDNYRLFKKDTDKVLSINDEKYYYCTRITTPEILNFIKEVIKKYPTYKEKFSEKNS